VEPTGEIDVALFHQAARTGFTTLETAVGAPIRAGEIWGKLGGFAKFGDATLMLEESYGSSFITAIRGRGSAPVQQQGTAPCDGSGHPRVVATTLATSAAGELFAFGSSCDRSAAVEVWKPGSTKSMLFFFDDTKAELIVGADGAVYLTGDKPQRWDGSSFTPTVEVPDYQSFKSRDGREWRFVFMEKLLLQKDGQFREVEIPQDQGAPCIVVHDKTTLWAIPQAAGGHLYRLDDGEGPTSVTVDDSDAGKPLNAPPKPPAPGGPRCAHNVVVLYGLTSVAPDDYDFPLTRKALKGHTELGDVHFAVTRDHEQRYLVGMSPSFELATKLRTTIEKGVKDSKPAIICAEPEIVRAFNLNLVTGELDR
jgi:hypothetical protein